MGSRDAHDVCRCEVVRVVEWWECGEVARGEVAKGDAKEGFDKGSAMWCEGERKVVVSSDPVLTTFQVDRARPSASIAC